MNRHELLEETPNITLSMPPILAYELEKHNLVLDKELTNLFINNLIDISIAVVKGRNLSLVDVVDIAKKFNIDYGNETLFKNLLACVTTTIAEFSSEILYKDIENYDLVITTCFSEKILLRKGVKFYLGH